ncbi:MAG: STAS-like domain-containing protein [Spirochaetes bacterium]|nr:STAS-like domain-containing protein [Spirochaetota bacterium]
MNTLVNERLLKISEVISPNLLLRDSVSNLFNQINSIDNANEVIIDFDGVSSMTRSFAHEFITMLKHNKHHIRIINESDYTHKMFELVKTP